MEEVCKSSNCSDDDLTSDELFNDITSLANSIQNCLPEYSHTSEKEDSKGHDDLENEQLQCLNSLSGSVVAPLASSGKLLIDETLNSEGNGCSVRSHSASIESKEINDSSNNSDGLFKEKENGHVQGLPGILTTTESGSDLSEGINDDSSFSRTSSDSLKEEYGDDLSDTRQKSCSLLSTQSEREFVLSQEKERRFARMSLERDRQPPIYSGFLSKLGGTGLTPKNWRKRWFVLKSDNCLYYYKNPKDNPVGAVVLSNYLVTTVLAKANKKFAFHLTKGGARSYTFAATSDIEKKTWMKVISEAAKSAEQIPASPESSIHNVSIPALSIKDPDCHGYLWKQGYSHKSWKKRYSVLKAGCLYYYQDMSETVALGMFNMHCYTVHETEITGRKYSFIAIPPQTVMRTYYFSAETEHDRDRWLKAMVRSIENADTEDE